MSDLIIPNLGDTVLERLKQLASASGRTTEAEAKEILREALQSIPSCSVDAWSSVLSIRNRLAASGRSFSDSTELIREDRG